MLVLAMLTSRFGAGMAQIAKSHRGVVAAQDHSLISKAFPYLFYFIPKCACTTLKTMLWRAELRAGGACSAPTSFADVHLEQDSPRSPWIRDSDTLLSRIGDAREELFWFAFVRNPYARAYSAYKWLAADGSAETRTGYLSRLGWLGRSPPSLTAYLELVASQDEADMDHHWAPITSLVALGDLNFDFVGSVERAAEDMPYVMNRIFGSEEYFDPTIHMHRSSSDEWSKTLEAIPRSALTLIREVYQSDFEAFGYSEDPSQLSPDRQRLSELSARGGISDRFRASVLSYKEKHNGPPPPTLAILSERLPRAEVNLLKGLVLRNDEMPEWWAKGGSQLWTLPGSTLPKIEIHGGFPNATRALIVLASDPQPEIVIWGDGATVVVGPDSPMPSARLICEGEAAIYLGPRTATSGHATVDARNGATVHVAGDQLWFPHVQVSTDGLHAIRDRATGVRINPYGADISIGNHVWLQASVRVHGGSEIGEDVIVEERSIVERPLPPHSFCAGAPARAIRMNVTWTHANEP